MIAITSFINDNNANLIEIYLSESKINDYKIDIKVTDENLEKLKKIFKITREIKYVHFYKNNLEYIYDTSNDSQLLITRKVMKDEYKITKKKYNLYTIAFNESKLPNHYFPCTNEIDHREEIQVTEFKINNRISILIKNNNYLIQYRHNVMVDLDKTEDIINTLVKKIYNAIQ